MIILLCQKLIRCRLESPRVEAQDGKPPGSGETDVSECKVNAISK